MIAINPVNEIRRCDSILESLGILKSDIPGFRTPQLAVVVDVFKAVYQRGFLYDCTVEHHKGTAEGRYVWPYTLENGWHALASLKASLDFHISTNRSPFFIGTQTDYYAKDNADFDRQSKANLAERRQAIVDFLEYALSKPEMRIVRLIDVIHWMRNPVALDGPLLVRLEARNTAVRGINIGDVRALQIAVPPISEQLEIVRQVDKLFALAEKLEAHYHRARARVEKFPQAILAKAFRGELVPQDPNDEPAEKLLERIRQERAGMESVGRAKKKPSVKPKRAKAKAMA